MKKPKLILSSYDIVFDPIEDEHQKDVDPKYKEEQEEIFYRLRSNPKECVPRLIALMEKCPDVPTLYNYLSSAYRLMGDNEKGKEVIIDAHMGK